VKTVKLSITDRPGLKVPSTCRIYSKAYSSIFKQRLKLSTC